MECAYSTFHKNNFASCKSYDALYSATMISCFQEGNAPSQGKI